MTGNRIQLATVLSITLMTVLVFINLDRLSYRVYFYAVKFGYPPTPYSDLFMGLLLFIAITGLVAVSTKNRLYLKLWLIKAFVTLVVMIPYEYYYGLDAYMYYANAILDTPVEEVKFGEAGTYNVIWANYMFTYVVGNSYYALKLLNSFIAFTGLFFLYKSYEYIMRKEGFALQNDRFIYVLFLFPSVLFWSSILGKDPLNLFFVGLFTYAAIRLVDHLGLKTVLLLTVGIIGVYYIRTWWSIIMLLSVALYYTHLNSFRHLLALLLVAPVFYLAFGYFLEMQHIASFQDLFDKMNYTSHALAYGGSSLEATRITGFADYALYYVPNLFTSLFRPMPWDVRNPFSLLAAVENVILLYFTYRYIFRNWREVFAHRYLRFLILFIFAWSLFYVIISPTNLGMAVRFKLQVLPAMLIIIGVSRQIYLNKKAQTLETA
jgi:hypothetical protein